MVVGQYTGDLPIQLNPCRPVPLMSIQFPILLGFGERPLLIAKVEELLDVFRIQGLFTFFSLLNFLL